MKTNLHELFSFGQSPWLDYISRKIIDNGHLQKMIDKGIVGVTSNPTIFEKAVSAGNDYESMLENLTQKGKSKEEIYDNITIRDVQDACDLFMPVYRKTNCKDGYVSLEINPQLAYDTNRSVEEAERLVQIVDRPNLMIKVPATEEGYPVIETLLSQGINVNVTLIFSLDQYRKSADAYLSGIEKAFLKRKDLSKINSVASVFVSRVDSLIDSLLEKEINKSDNEREKSELKSLMGKSAIANSQLIYRQNKKIFSLPRFQEMTKNNANKQRVLWASTSTKNPNYSDVKYVKELIAPETVNTMTEDTIEAFIDHGKVEIAITDNIVAAEQVISNLKERKIFIDEICQHLLEDGVKKFIDSFQSLLEAIEKKKESF